MLIKILFFLLNYLPIISTEIGEKRWEITRIIRDEQKEEMKKVENYLRPVVIRMLSYIIGLIILSFGITLTILSGLGTGAWDAINVGLANRTAFSVGNWVIFVGMIVIIVNALLTKSRPVVFSLLTVIILGFLIDGWLLFVFPLTIFTGLLLQLSVLIVGMVVIAFGVSIYIQAEFAVVPVDGLMLAIKDVFGVNFMVAKIITELLGLVIAFLVGGPIGLGTVIVTVFLGPLIQLFLPPIRKRIYWQIV